MSRERWVDEALEASDRALFARRRRALPSQPVPALEAILAAADARPARTSGRAGRAGVLVAVSLGIAAAAAVVVGVAAASSLATHERRARAIVADDGDASVPIAAGWTSYEPPICEPGADDPGAGETCAAVPASLVMASSDGIPRASVESMDPPGHADDFALTCKREPEMSTP
ncbi:MAG TPA: hypothetical protein VF765_12260 [Polyangiaceae bacterium]